MKLLLTIFGSLFVISTVLAAEITNECSALFSAPIPRAVIYTQDYLKVGAKIKLQRLGQGEVEMIFIGKLLSNQGVVDGFAFFNDKTKEIQILEPNEILASGISVAKVFANGEIVVRSQIQTRPTCGAQATWAAIWQIYQNHPNLRTVLSMMGDEAARRKFNDALNQDLYGGFFGGTAARFNRTISRLASEMGLRYWSEKQGGYPSEMNKKFIDQIKIQLKLKWPVILEIGVTEQVLPLSINGKTDYHYFAPYVPENKYQGFGRHIVLLTNYFSSGDKTYYVVTDSNIDFPIVILEDTFLRSLDTKGGAMDVISFWQQW